MALRPSTSSITMIACFSMVLVHVLCVTAVRESTPIKVFSILSYGAFANEKIDNSQAFLRAWKEACEWNGRSRVLIPPGTYMLNSVLFVGPCKGSMAFLIKGNLKAPTDPNLFFNDHWISFRYVDKLVVKGGGYLYGQGASAWHYNDCATNPNCRPLPITMRFDFVTNSMINHIRSIDSKNAHFNLFACDNITMSYIRITAPDGSPNTDGIHIGDSTNIKIKRSVIGTGDDCISMISGSRNIKISKVTCGPGHGFSVGSLGKSYNEQHVTGITITNSTLKGTQNGLRIKTWAPSSPSLASDIIFENIIMEGVNNPIFIDQQYCPRPPCSDQAQSNVRISNVTFNNIKGTSSSKDAIKLICSGLVPCERVKLVNINLAYNGRDGPVSSSCFNVNGISYGSQLPPSCL